MRIFKIGALAACSLAALLTCASAADLARPAYRAPFIAAPGFSWTGFYIGGNLGAGWGTKQYEQPIPLGTVLGGAPTLISDGSSTVNGLLGGGQVGYNYQWGPTVWGIEFQGDAADVKGTGSCGVAALFNCHTKVDGILTLAGRFGLTWDHTMLYVKGGGAWAHDHYDVNLLGLSFAIGPVSITPASASEWRSGWMIGAGVEQAISGNWSAKIEYDYMDFGTKTDQFPVVTVAGTPAVTGLLSRFDITQQVHLIKFGINYRFGYYAAPAVYK
jgi:outer membrane immunogenic protein